MGGKKFLYRFAYCLAIELFYVKEYGKHFLILGIW